MDVDEDWKRKAQEEKRQAAADAAPPERGPVTFSAFVASIATQAMMALGLIHEKGKPPPPPDLAHAQSLIDLLALLEEKTKGNLAPDESSLLRTTLYDLRMTFVELARGAPAPPESPGPTIVTP